jgi:activator of HSP90 ATPase
VSSRVLVALRVKATRERAFEVFTAEIGDWWRPSTLFAFTPRSPGMLSFETGPQGRLIEILSNGKVFEIGAVRVWDPPRRLVFDWRQATFAPGQMTQVEVRFDAVGSETRVTVEHTGWDSVPASHVARHGWPETLFLRRHGEWWQSVLEGLSERILGGEGR